MLKKISCFNNKNILKELFGKLKNSKSYLKPNFFYILKKKIKVQNQFFYYSLKYYNDLSLLGPKRLYLFMIIEA